ncbi:MAG: hypothetical protein KDA41_15975, partial [Planctomycetales bacterium]|nr:hypothetical protein [Planctomycetales bacterium]
CRRDRITFDAPDRRDFSLSTEAFDQLQATYLRANDQRWAAQVVDTVDGRASARLKIPNECYGACHVRVYVDGDRAAAIGASDIFVHSDKVDAERDPFSE